MRIRIESNGTPGGTKITNAETGELVHGVQRVVLDLDVRERRLLTTVTLAGAEIDVTAGRTRRAR